MVWLSDGRLWRWLAGFAYAALVALTLVGNDGWRVGAAPYLNIAFFVGLWAIIWRSLRRKTKAELAADERQTFASLRGGPVDMALAERYGLVDETGQLIEPPPPSAATTVDIVAPSRQRFALWPFVLKLLLTPVFVLMVWVVAQMGLALAAWVRGLV